MSAGLVRGRLPLLLAGASTLALASALALAGQPPGLDGATPMGNDAVDFNLPRRVLCRSSTTLGVKKDAQQMYFTVSPVPGKVVSSVSELKEGQCAGLKHPDNELSPKVYGAFGPKVTGPLSLFLINLSVTPRVTILKDGRATGLEAVPLTAGGALPEGVQTTSLRNILQWAREGKGGLELTVNHNTTNPRVGFFADLHATTIYKP